MSKYGVVKTSFTLASGNNATLIVAATSGYGKTVRVYEVSISGQATSSSVLVVGAGRNASGTVSATNQTPQVLEPFGAAYIGGAATTTVVGGDAGAQNTGTAGTTTPLINVSLNAFGGIYRWVAPPGSEMVITGTDQTTSAQWALTAASGSAAAGAHILFELP